jgi:hypothetical protein
MIPKIEPTIPREYEAFLDMCPIREPTANDANVTIKKSTIRESNLFLSPVQYVGDPLLLPLSIAFQASPYIIANLREFGLV